MFISDNANYSVKQKIGVHAINPDLYFSVRFSNNFG